jgi:uncharacterized repeat protein (TIGR03833 family)
VDPDPRRRADIPIGVHVDVIRKEDQASGAVRRGKVREFLTNSSTHPQGVKVRLEDGTIGRVARVHTGEPAAVEGSRPGGDESGGGAGSDTSSPTDPAGRGDAPRARGGGSSSSSPKPSKPSKSDVVGGSPKKKEEPRTVYLSNIPKALGKKDVAWLLEELPGVTGVRLPRRGGKNMGYAFVLTESESKAAKVIETLCGVELEGRRLVAELAKEPTKESNPGRDESGKAGKAGSDVKRGGGTSKRRSRKGPAPAAVDDGDDDEEPLLDPIAIARAEMEADAILQLERAKRAAAKRAAEAEAVLAERRAAEAALEAKTSAMLAERRRQAEAREARIALERAREEAIRDEANALGPPRVGEGWEIESQELREALGALRSQSGSVERRAL